MDEPRPVLSEKLSDGGCGFMGHLFSLMHLQTGIVLLPGEFLAPELSDFTVAFSGRNPRTVGETHDPH